MIDPFPESKAGVAVLSGRDIKLGKIGKNIEERPKEKPVLLIILYSRDR